jgi:hypothetical protein
MDGVQASTSPQDLYAHLGTAAAPIRIDVRHLPTFAAAPTLIASAFYRAPEEVHDPALERLAAIVRAADTSRHNAPRYSRSRSASRRISRTTVQCWRTA